MTRRCSWCGTWLGEKCPRCGAGNPHRSGYTRKIETTIPDQRGYREDNRISEGSHGSGHYTDDPLSPRLYKCSNAQCNLTFVEGDGGLTHGMCENCEKKTRQGELHDKERRP